jgi:hypothetical protein
MGTPWVFSGTGFQPVRITGRRPVPLSSKNYTQKGFLLTPAKEYFNLIVVEETKNASLLVPVLLF